MPGKDGTGPQGQGPKTGRGLGKCNAGGRTKAPQGPGGRGSGRGAGRGKGQGSGRGTRRSSGKGGRKGW